MDEGYRSARGQQWILLVCCALLAVIMAIVAGYLFVRSRTSDVLERRGVHTEATVESTSAEHAVVTFRTADGDRTVEIERLGPTLCPDSDIVNRFRGCADIADGLRFRIVYDPDHPDTAQPADVVGATSSLVSAAICGVIAALMLALAIGRWRWLRELASLREPDAPRHAVRVVRFRNFGQRWLFGIRLFLVRVDVIPAGEVGEPVRLMLTAPQGLQWLAEGVQATAIGELASGRAVALVDVASTAYPTRKAHRAKPGQPLSSSSSTSSASS